jgi:uncharacterized protein (DUF362 family)
VPAEDGPPPIGPILDDSGINFSILRHVVVKPNWVQEAHEYKPDLWEPVITDPGLILAVVDSIAARLSDGSTISICDAPHTYASFDAIVGRGDFSARLESLKNKHKRIDIELIDLRREVWIRIEEVVVDRLRNTQDPRGYVRLDLSKDSLFFEHSGEGHYYGADYDSGVVNEHHQGAIHEYLIAGTPISCDLFVNLPKLKTHKKTGITCCLKNLVGINGDKNWLPHHTEGGASSGGDEFPSEGYIQWVERKLKMVGRKTALLVPGLGTWLYRRMRITGKAVLGDSETTVRNGNWHGNDTTWRMALDLNRALLYGNPDGSWRERGQSKAFFAIVDGMIGGEGNGPICPDWIDSRVIIAGDNPAEVDAVCARLMGFDPAQIPIVARAFDSHRWPISVATLENLSVQDDREGRIVPLSDLSPAVPHGFKPHFGWQRLNTARKVTHGS